ncbi:efflux RND transporter periplasmic adaptor subunit [Methylophilus sp. DW102]|uniref:efflux RND transporter periplasmic adaptor subunit n=1 Tax=Methylophilus sp. DW102 TaxID=3095607 RepID=UPI00308EA2CE|nr:efflux RND transporter periplasmic adaptor subunit [Methylophilus sp. DW102]
MMRSFTSMASPPATVKAMRQFVFILCAIGVCMASAMAADKNARVPAQPANQIVLTPGSPQLNSLKIEPVTEIPVPVTEPLNGKIVFDENRTARVYSPVAGRALNIQAQIGEAVKTGQPLLVMDSPDVGAAVADVGKAQADLGLKQQALERSRMLVEGGVLARKDMEVAQADWASARAEHERAMARLKNLRVSTGASDRYVVRSPIAGVVVDRKVNPGSEVRPDAADPLFLITDPSHVWASIDLPERDLSRISQGQKLSVQVDAYPDEVFDGEIKTIGIMVDPTTRRIPVRCLLDSKGKLKPEMYARITPLDTSQHRVIRVPNSALITEGLYSYVFVEEQPLHFSKRKVVLDLQRREYATVKTGLNPGERIVTSGAILLNSDLSVSK